MRRPILQLLKIALIIYVLACGILYLSQERLLFFPDRLEKDYKFTFTQKFQEIPILTEDKKKLSAVLFPADSSKGVIFYLHGNAGSIDSWGEVAKYYTNLNFDVFLLDYRGYGKSDGAIESQKQLFQDIQVAYNEVRKRYKEDNIIVLGYSIGTGPAAKLASQNNPKLLLLQAPYYSLTDMMKHAYPIVPTFILKYNLKTNEYLKGCKMPVVVFHGNQDEVIYYGSSIKLKKNFKTSDTLITLNGQGHNGMTNNADYRMELKRILDQ